MKTLRIRTILRTHSNSGMATDMGVDDMSTRHDWYAHGWDDEMQ